jgi:hypothetical protein
VYKEGTELEKNIILADVLRNFLPYGPRELIPFDRMELNQEKYSATLFWRISHEYCSDHFLGILPGHIILEAAAQAAVCYAKATNPSLRDKYPLLKDFEGHLNAIVTADDELTFFISDFYPTSLHHGSVRAKVYLNGIEAASLQIWFKIFSSRAFHRLDEGKKKSHSVSSLFVIISL